MGIISILLVSICIYGNEYFPVDFFTSMQHTPHFDKNKATQDSIWNECANRYNALVNNDYWQEEPRIPKKIHRIWLGSPLPEKEYKFGLTWIEHHPDWEYKLWTEKEIDEFGLVNRKIYDSTKNYGEKSDIARYEILYREGGLYIDTDFECLQSFELLHHCCDFFAGINCLTDFEVFMGLIGCVPGHPILKCCIEMVPKYRDKHSILARTGPYFFTDCIRRSISSCSPYTILFPTTYFYPWPFYARNEISMQKIRAWVKPESYAIHHWHVSWNKG